VRRCTDHDHRVLPGAPTRDSKLAESDRRRAQIFRSGCGAPLSAAARHFAGESRVGDRPARWRGPARAAEARGAEPDPSGGAAARRATVFRPGTQRRRRTMKPIMNLADAVFDDVEDNGFYTSRRASIGKHIGAKQLGYNLTELPPGKAQCPFHNHHGDEEMFLILEGNGELRFGAERYPIRAHDVIACPAGGPDVAHQIINTGQVPMRYLALSKQSTIETCEYPDSGKIMIYADPGRAGERPLWKMFRAENTVDYYDRENTEDPKSD
jgi:uncharacterized cupin superfamily protein